MTEGVDPHVIVISEAEPELNLDGTGLDWTSGTEQHVVEAPDPGHELALDEAELDGPGEASLAVNRTLLSAIVSPESSG